MDNSTRRQLLDRARSTGYPGSILDAFTAYDQGRDLIGEFINQQQQAAAQPPMQVAETPEEQGQGLRPYHEQGQINQSMAFPNVQPGQSFNTMGMKVPINIDKIDNQGNLVESYKAVPPGIANLPTGPYEGTVIESPARMQKGGKRRDPDQPFFESETEEGTYETQYSQPEVTVTPDWTAEEIERNRLRDEYIAKDKKFFRHWYDKLGYDRKNVIKRANQFAYNTLAKQYLKEDPENLTPEQIKFIKKSEYANRLEPSIGERFVEGVTNPGLNLETLGNVAAPFEYPTNLVRGAVKGEFIDALKGRTPSPYFVSSDLPTGTSATEAAIASNLVDFGVDAGIGGATPSTISKGAEAITSQGNKLKKAVKGSESVFKEITGELSQGKINRKSIERGNEWLQDWINDPATQAKIDKDIDKSIEFAGILKDPSRSIKLLNLTREQLKNFKPDSKEYGLLKQLDQNLQQYLSKNKQDTMHQGNLGVSYMHAYDPLERYLISKGDLLPRSDRYGSWISRNPKISQERRINTTIHEGTHDWVSEETFKNSGMRNIALKNMDPEIKKDFLIYEEHRANGVDPFKKMDREAAYQAYLADPTEQHARIMELRHQLGITPDYVMDSKTAEKIMERIEEGKTTVDPRFLKVIKKDPKRLAELFNRFWAITPAAMVGTAAMQERKQMGGSYETKQETAMYEWRSGLPEDSRKMYIKGGLKNRVLYNKAKYKR